VQRDEWTKLPTSKMKLEKEFSVFNHSRWFGQLAVYRFTDPAPNPPDILRIRSKMLGRTLDFDMGGR
jgi:hypothetical protein